MRDAASGSDIAIAEAEIGPSGVTVVWHDGRRHAFHALWLRERSDSPDNRDPGTGLRVTQAAFLPLDIRVTAAEADEDGGLSLQFSDGHACRYRARDLLGAVTRPWPDDLVGEKTLWDGAARDLPEAIYRHVLEDEGAVLDLLDGLARSGAVRVRDMPEDVRVPPG